MNCSDIIKKYLRKNGYDGLINEEGCSCPLDDFDMCGEGQFNCEPAYKIMCSELTDKQKEDCESQPCDSCTAKYLMFRDKKESK